MKPLSEQQIRNIIKDEIRKSNSSLRFQYTGIPRHTHNGTDSPYITNQSVTYAGAIGSDGSPILLPKGWSVTYDATGFYTVTHNLWSQNGGGAQDTNLPYAVVTTALQSTNELVVCVATPFPDSTTFGWFLSHTDPPTAQDTSFFFQFTAINNKNPNPPSYFSDSFLF